MVAAAASPLTAALARRVGIVDRPDPAVGGYKRHASETPYLGGLAIAAGLAAGGALVLFLSDASTKELVRLVVWGGGAALLLGTLGLIDDVRPMPAWSRFAVEIAAAAGAWQLGFDVSIAPWGPVNFVLTVLWIVGITNAFNLLDNMDGLSAGVAAVSGVSFAVMGLLSANPALAIVSAALAGGCLGFLAHNRYPAKLFMGDSGSLLLGFLLALIGVRLQFDNLLQVTFLVPVVVLGVPIFDTALVVVGRLAHGRGPFTAGRDHTSHRLVALGLPVREAVGLLYWAGLCLGWLGLVITRANVQVGWMLLGFVLAMGAFCGRLMWKIPVYGTVPSQETDEPSRSAR
jgi:UDP-GlcNAc:undecaprenyl-phosphate GlcNAc-1-phosphate transferase